MRGCHRPILLAFITFLVNGLTYGQDNEPYCGTFCLAAEVTCTCTLSEGSLTWEVRNANGSVVGQRSVNEGDLNNPTELFGEDDFEAASAFGIIVISSMSGTFTSEMSFDTLSEYQGYQIECKVSDGSSSRTINVAEPPTVANLNLTSFTTDSALLTFERSISGDCVVNYTITTNAGVPSSPISDTSVTISKLPNDPEEATYFVCVSAVDFAETTGPQSCLDCFRFTSPNAVMFHNDVTYAYTTVCVATIEWTPDSCLPVATDYNVTINSSAVVPVRNVSTTTLQISSVAYEEEYTVTVTPSNTFGFGVPASTAFIAPTGCPVILERTSPSPTSGSASLLFPGSGVLPVGLIAGFILSFGFSAIMF